MGQATGTGTIGVYIAFVKVAPLHLLKGKSFIKPDNLADSRAQRQPDPFPILYNSLSCLDPESEIRVVMNRYLLSRDERCRTRPKLSVSQHLCELVPLKRPLESSHDGKKRPRKQNRGRLYIRKDIALI